MSLQNLKLRNIESRPLTFQEGDDNIRILASASVASMSFDSSSLSLVFYNYPSSSGIPAFSSSLENFTSSLALTASHFVVTGSSYVSGSITITGSIEVSGSASIEYAKIAKLEVTELTASTTLVSTGSNIFGDNLSDIQQFTGSSQFSSSINVNGVANITGSLVVSGSETNIITPLTRLGYITDDGLGNYSYTSSMINLTGSVKITGSFSVNGNELNIDNIIDTGSSTVTQFISGTLNLVGDGLGQPVVSVSESRVNISSSFGVTGSTILSGSTTITNTLVISGSSTTTGSNTTIGVQVVSGSTLLTGSATLEGPLQVSGTLGVTGSEVNVKSLDVLFDTTKTTISGSTRLSGSVLVTGPSIISGSQTISGSTIQSGSFDLFGTGSISGSLFVDGDSYFRTTSSFDGPLSVTTHTKLGSVVDTPDTLSSQIEITGSIRTSGSLYVTASTVNISSSNNLVLSVSGSSGSWNSGLIIHGLAETASAFLLAIDTASNVVNYRSAANLGFPYTGSAGISGSLLVNGTNANIQFTSSFVEVSGSTRQTGSVYLSGSMYISDAISASVLLPSGTVGFFGTASQALTASYAFGAVGVVTTGSNALVQIITGSLVITGSVSGSNGELTASNLLVTNRLTVFELFTQFITSSTTVNTGSNIFGDNVGIDVHQFTGSVRMTGSLSMDESPFLLKNGGDWWRITPVSTRLYFEYSSDSGSNWNDSIYFQAQ